MIGGFFASAFAFVESKDKRVSDISMDADEYIKVRRYGKDIFEISCKASELKRGLMGHMWGANVWVLKEAKGITCYPEKGIEKKFKFIAESKRILGIKD